MDGAAKNHLGVSTLPKILCRRKSKAEEWIDESQGEGIQREATKDRDVIEFIASGMDERELQWDRMDRHRRMHMQFLLGLIAYSNDEDGEPFSGGVSRSKVVTTGR